MIEEDRQDVASKVSPDTANKDLVVLKVLFNFWSEMNDWPVTFQQNVKDFQRGLTEVLM